MLVPPLSPNGRGEILAKSNFMDIFILNFIENFTIHNLVMYIILFGQTKQAKKIRLAKLQTLFLKLLNYINSYRAALVAGTEASSNKIT